MKSWKCSPHDEISALEGEALKSSCAFSWQACIPLGHVNPQQEGSPLQAWERLSEDTQTPDLRTSASRAVRSICCSCPLGLWRTVQQSKWIKRGLYSEKSQGHSRAEPYPSLLPVPLCCRRLLRNAFLISLCRRMQTGSRTEWIYITSKAPLSSYRSLG